MSVPTRLSIDAFIRALAINQGRPICVLLGAGASISSGMPSAERCIWEWKQEIFVTNNPTLRESVGELSLPGTKSRIQKWLDQRDQYPPLNDFKEYSFYAHECYPTSQDRRAFFQGHVEKANPHVGYRLLPLLSKAGIIRSVWTTNFDGLAARAAAAANLICVEVGIDSQQRAERPQSINELRIISIHGDYRYDDLKNTTNELQTQETQLRGELLHELKDHDLVVIGYSGRDSSIMEILQSSASSTSPCRLYWCGYGDDTPNQVEALIQTARSAGKDAFYVPTDGFDDLFSRLSLRQLDGELLKNAKEILESSIETQAAAVSFELNLAPITALVKSNAYPFTFPTHALKFDLEIPPEANRRKWFDDQLPIEQGAGVLMHNGAIAFAESSDVKSCFGNALRGNTMSMAISDTDIAGDGRISSLVKRAFIQAVARHLGCKTDGTRRVWETQHDRQHSLEGKTFQIHRALAVRLETINKIPHVVLMPEYVASSSDGSMADRETTKLIRTALYGYQHNDVFDADIKHWTKKIADIDMPAFGGGIFRMHHAPIYAGLHQKGRSALSPSMQNHARQRGVVVTDADLLFSSLNGKIEVKNPNPLKGLVENRPWDFQLTTSGLSPSVEMAAICPSQDAGNLKRFLAQFQETSTPSKSERDYLQDFPGFSKAFGLPLITPVKGTSSWIDIDDAVTGDPLTSAKSLAERICKALDSIRSLRPGAIVAIFVPVRWVTYEKFESETEHFDLHHFIKAYAARHGQSTQFIRHKTTVTPQPCRVRWWLSLALYAKAMRTPWRLDCLDDDTAFVGIGYSFDSHALQTKQILLGCSHLYNARGEGLQFRLGRIENPIIRGKNPFMSIDDARRVGETIRQLFFDAKMKLPARVVVHKRTPFTNDEQIGLIQGLDGVANIELIEITIEESLRYLSSKMDNESLVIDKFPIPRGSAIILDSASALLWVHGVTPNAMNPSWKYYQGKRRIPTPLLIRRYKGQSDIVQVATEILGLSKMNWNTFDYYSRLPATLDSASAIAKVGDYLSGFSSASYDYRLLI